MNNDWKKTDWNHALESMSPAELDMTTQSLTAEKARLEDRLSILNQDFAALRIDENSEHGELETAIQNFVAALIPELKHAVFRNLKTILPDADELTETDWLKRCETERRKIQKEIDRIAERGDENFTASAANARLEILAAEKETFENQLFYWHEADATAFGGLKTRGFNSPAYNLSWFNVQYWKDYFAARRLRKKFAVSSFNELEANFESFNSGRQAFDEEVAAANRVVEDSQEIEKLRENYDFAEARTLEHTRILLRNALWKLKKPVTAPQQNLFDEFYQRKQNYLELAELNRERETEINQITADTAKLAKIIALCQQISASLQSRNNYVHTTDDNSFFNNSPSVAAISYDSYVTAETPTPTETESPFGGNADFGGGGSGVSWENFS